MLPRQARLFCRAAIGLSVNAVATARSANASVARSHAAASGSGSAAQSASAAGGFRFSAKYHQSFHIWASALPAIVCNWPHHATIGRPVSISSFARPPPWTALRIT